jgi:hypothetical protein
MWSTASAQTRLPDLRVSLSESRLEFSPSVVGEWATLGFRIVNDTQCQVRMVRMSDDPVAPFRATCRLEVNQAIPGGGSADCNVEYRPVGAVTSQDTFAIEVGYGPMCILEASAAVDDHHEDTETKLEEQLSELGTDADVVEAGNAKIAAAKSVHQARHAELEERLSTIQDETQAVVDAVNAEHQAARKRSEQTVAQLEEVIKLMSESGPDLTPVVEKAVPRAQAFDTRARELEKRRDEACWKIDSLTEGREKALAELRRGEYCSECKRPRSRIEREEGVTFESHLRSVHGQAVPASPEMLAKEEAHWTTLLENANSSCASAKESVLALQIQVDGARLEFDRQVAALEQRHEARLDELGKKVAQAQLAWSQEDLGFKLKLQSARADADALVRTAAAAVKDSRQKEVDDLGRLQLALESARKERLSRERKLVSDLASLRAAWQRNLDQISMQGRMTVTLRLSVLGRAER